MPKDPAETSVKALFDRRNAAVIKAIAALPSYQRTDFLVFVGAGEPALSALG